MQKDLLLLHTVNIGPLFRIPVICFISVVFEKYISKIIVNKSTNVHTPAAFVINIGILISGYHITEGSIQKIIIMSAEENQVE